MIMEKTNYRISSFQLFFLVFAYVFSGLFIYARASLASTLLACALAAAICIVAGHICRDFSSSLDFYGAVFGKFSGLVRFLNLAFLAFAAVRALYAFSLEICAYYKGANAALVFLICVFLAAFSVFRRFSPAARFAELSAFAVFAIILLCFLGKGGEVSLSFSADDVLLSFDALGSATVIFSLYLRAVTSEDASMSDFARNGGKHPSPTLCGALGSVCAGALYLFICARGGMSNILLLLFAWMICIAGFFASAVCASDVLGVPECKKGKTAQKAVLFAALCAAGLLSRRLAPEYLWVEVSGVYNVILFGALFVLVFVGERRKIHAGSKR